jgi:uncharacterized membrane protein
MKLRLSRLAERLGTSYWLLPSLCVALAIGLSYVTLRLICPRPDWSAYVRLAVDEVRRYGEGSFQIVQRLRFLLEDLLRVAPTFRREELERQLSLLEASVERAFTDEREARMAHRANPQGHGPH